MDETARMWMEISFNIAYLGVIWVIVALMIAQRRQVPAHAWPVVRLLIWAFGLLALGDTGHVGFRVWAYALDGLDTTLSVGGVDIGLVGLGALATSITVTVFYMLLVAVWRARFDKPYGWFGILLLVLGVARFVIIVFPQNEWNSAVPPQPWSLIRNLPLMIMGLGVAYLFLRDASRTHDRPFQWFGWLIVASYAFYLPVILFVQQAPMIGMLMIPKTLAYLGMALIVYRTFFMAPYPQPQSAD